MMKSFFKKLSLVMALAMVVTMMAPAASAFAADLLIAGQNEAKADAKAEYSVAVGEEVDFKFYNAGKGWQDSYNWTSSDETVAKTLVNEKGKQDGKFLGLKDGEVEITLTIGEQKATVKLVVGKGNVNMEAFKVEQVSDEKVKLTFENTAITKEQLAAGLTTYFYVGDVKVNYPVFKVNKVENGVAEVESYALFTDKTTIFIIAEFTACH